MKAYFVHIIITWNLLLTLICGTGSLSPDQALDQNTRSMLTGVDVIIKPSSGPLQVY